MKYCPNCRAEYLEEIKICADCDVELVDSLIEAEEITESDLTLIYQCDQLYKAQLIKANLESANIESFILSQKDSNYPSVGDLAIIKLFVKNEDAETALEFINNSEQSDFDFEEE